MRYVNNHSFIYRVVSIHAPARGAIGVIAPIRPRKVVSIHAPARGAMLVSGLLVLIGEFQFTHPRGVRSKEDLMKCNLTVSIHAPARDAISRNPLHRTRRSFNSRTREGCDVLRTGFFFPGVVSIHAPARGAILVTFCVACALQFQFTHPRGVR